MWHRTSKLFEIPVKKSRLSQSSKQSKRTFLVCLSIKNAKGVLEKFEYRGKAPDKEQAVQDAMQTVAAAGLEPWVLLDVVELHRGDELIGA